VLELCLGADEEFIGHGAFGMMPIAPGHDDQGQLDRHPQVCDRLRRDFAALAAGEYLRSTLDLAPRLADVDGGALMRCSGHGSPTYHAGRRAALYPRTAGQISGRSLIEISAWKSGNDATAGLRPPADITGDRRHGCFSATSGLKAPQQSTLSVALTQFKNPCSGSKRLVRSEWSRCRPRYPTS
jgi:hypothetical protein